MTLAAAPEILEGSLYPEEEPFVCRAVPKRRREFTAGRLLARRAFAQLGIAHYPLRMGGDREPLWPAGVVGSISHCDGCCGVAVARTDAIRSLGLDIELAAPLTRDLVRLVCSPAEVQRIERLSHAGAPDWAKIVFSAKESVYKCVFPLARRFLDFHDVEIVLDPPAGTFAATVLPVAGLRLAGRFAIDGERVWTGVALAPASP